MKSRRSLLPIFFLFFLLALGLFLFSSTSAGKSFAGVFEQMILPLQKSMFVSFGYGSPNNTPEAKLRDENAKLQTQLAKHEAMERENNALRDQFKTTTPSPKQLIPAQIIGAKNDDFILDKGSAQGVTEGNVLIVKDNLVGRVTKVSAHRSIAELLTKKGLTFTAKTSKTEALGIVQGQGDGKLALLNVVLADKLEKNDLVLTKGDIDQSGKGFPPNLVVGKIVSVNKKASNLFQSAELVPLIEFGKLETVFVMTE